MKTFETIREDSRLEDLASSNDSNLRSHRSDTQGENSSSGSQVQNRDVTIEKDAPLTGMVEAVDGGINDQQNFSEKEGNSRYILDWIDPVSIFPPASRSSKPLINICDIKYASRYT